MKRKRQWFKWTVELEVHRTWVEGGFDLTDERAKEMLARDLSFADWSELRARVVAAPDERTLAEAHCHGAAARRNRQ